ncbi:low molecular weight phosphotyrosine protein phosphatase [Salmonella enterica subsp. enterica]|uniref:Low molecular weight phosphotyrosine protein phosphatase n=1 Tax=Salmonella enterica I TaxID=59201 RepID=A0A379WZX6_SALET|nr:low molecular weight phosphotyrosine protein phosphatase [Salmonella enterica subsp. enterica]
MNVLFICSRNQWRSPTAEQVFRRYPDLSVRSAGTSRNAKKSVSCGLLQWADVICVMEQKHKDRLMAEYRRIIENKPCTYSISPTIIAIWTLNWSGNWKSWCRKCWGYRHCRKEMSIIDHDYIHLISVKRKLDDKFHIRQRAV